MSHGGYRQPAPKAEREFYQEHFASTPTRAFHQIFNERFGLSLTLTQINSRACNWRIRKSEDTSRIRAPLTRGEDAFFKEHYPTNSNKEFAELYQESYRRKIGWRSIRNIAHSLNLKKSIPEGWVETKEAAELLDLEFSRFHVYRRKAGVKHTRFGVHSAITIEQLDQIEYLLDEVGYYEKQKRNNQESAK